MNTLRGNWGYAAKLTGGYVFGSAGLFERKEPWLASSPGPRARTWFAR